MAPLRILGQTIQPGEYAKVNIPFPGLFDGEPQQVSAHVMHGMEPGNVLLLTAAIHGDELNGIEIIRKVLRSKKIKRLKGTLIAIPVVNIYGLNHRQRYLIDGRDLNRSFPGAKKGTLASRVAYQLTHEIIRKATHIVDLHTGAVNRTNLPQIRTDLEAPGNLALAKAFGAPVVLHSNLRQGSLRKIAARLKIPAIVYEAGEALRFDESSIKIGYQGVLSVMNHLGMIKGPKLVAKYPPIICQASAWVRSKKSGLFSTKKSLGSSIMTQDVIGQVAMPMALNEERIISPVGGVIIGMNKTPLVHEGAPLFNIGLHDRLNKKQLKTLELLDNDDVELLVD